MISKCPYLMPTKETVCSIPGLMYFIWEREAIRLARVNEYPAPWTVDPVLAKYKFTNIHRKHDRGSKWIIDNLIMANDNREKPHLWFTLLIARLINWPPTLQALVDAGVIPCTPADFDAELFVETIESLKVEGKKVYTGSYMVYPAKRDPGGNKSEAMAKYILGDVVSKACDINDALWGPHEVGVEVFVEALSKCFGISTFIAGQVAADLTYAPGHLEEAVDLYTYAPIGPGSSRGLNYLLDRKPYASWKSIEFCMTLQDINYHVKHNLDIPGLTLHDVQNCMCEYSKYCKTLLEEGSPKSTYKPETEY